MPRNVIINLHQRHSGEKMRQKVNFLPLFFQKILVCLRLIFLKWASSNFDLMEPSKFFITKLEIDEI